MSGHGSSQDCPNCNGVDTLQTWLETRPHDQFSGECLRCGYYFFTQNGFMSREDLIERRKDLENYPRIYRGKNKMDKW